MRKLKFKVYLMEAICLGLFMLSAATFASLLEYRGSVVHQAIPDPTLRRWGMGIGMGVTASLLIYSPMARLSGGHMNPAVTLSFLHLKKMDLRDAVWYILFQCAGGIAAVFLMACVWGNALADPSVNYVVTIPGKYGVLPAFIAEVTIAFVMMGMVLLTSNHPTWSGYTGLIAGFLVMIYVVLAGPVSGFGMNPARTLASAVPAGQYASLWIYLSGPVIGMLSAAFLYSKLVGLPICAKLHHSPAHVCIFRCGYQPSSRRSNDRLSAFVLTAYKPFNTDLNNNKK